MGKRRWTEEKLTSIVKALANGESIESIAKAHNVSHFAIRSATRYWRSQRVISKVRSKYTEPIKYEPPIKITPAEREAISKLYKPKAKLPVKLAKYAGKGPIE